MLSVVCLEGSGEWGEEGRGSISVESPVNPVSAIRDVNVSFFL